MNSVTTPWGKATLVSEISLAQRSGEKRFSTVVQLLESDKGERLVRFAYTSPGGGRRGPVTLRAQDVARLHAALERNHALRTALIPEGR
jgi:hypothetical protein